ncbi:tripartite tricarboxylate transporter substrate binding protein [Bordetella petrii]|uniref:tripartite tricarboxylate transporter substrate binding protein n=1 Tax=Bordetella petrii TaxID=94624 RepID=UPI003731FDBF
MKYLRMVIAMVMASAGATALADYPDRPVRLIVPYSAGGAADTQARLIAKHLAERLGQQIIVENRPGASGTIGAAAVARAPADGYTLLYDATAHAVNPALYPSLSYDTRKDFYPLSLVSRTPNLLVVPVQSPYETLADLTAAARREPGKLTYASAGNGTAQHIAAELYARGAGIKLTHIPYKGGAPALADLMGQQTDMMFSNMTASYPLVQSRRLRVLAVSSQDRVAALPDTPAVAESGIPGYQVYEWNGMFAPAGVAPATLARLEEEIRAVLALAPVQQRFKELGAQPVGSSSEEFRVFLGREMQRAAEVLANAGIEAR